MKRLLLVALLLLPGAARGHEIGTTQVRLAMQRDGTWSALITTGPQALANKLEVKTRQPRSSDLDEAALRARLEQLIDPLAEEIDVRFDGVASPARLAIDTLQLPPDITLPSFVVLRATGAIPPQAHTVTWRYRLAYATYSLTFTASDQGSPLTLWLEGDAATEPLSVAVSVTPPTRLEIIWQYLQLGFLHIIPEGLDHILFVLGIFLLTTKLRPILIQVTAFTVAHSITLGLTMYGIVSLSPRIVEPMISLSIVYVAVENIVTATLTPWRPALVFAFGLLHGMGFADVLRELGLPRNEFIPALVSFNVGIELAQLTVIAAAYVAVAMRWRDKPWYRARIVIPGSALIAAIGLLWTVQRIAGL